MAIVDVPLKSIRSGKVKVAGAPVGHHPATFTDAFEMPPADNGYGPAMKLVWTLDDGSEATRICPLEPTARNVTGKLLTGLLGKQLVPNTDWNIGPCVGQRYLIVVEMSESGNGTRVTSCHKPD
jgi:hypothetical protein